MRRFTIFALLIFCVLSVMIFAWAKQSNAPDLLAELKARHPFSSSEMTWHSITRTLTSDGLIFYRPAFANLPVRAQAERLTIRSTPTTLSFRFSSGIIDAAQTLISSGPQKTLETVKAFHEPVDFLRHPLTALAILNHDVLKGNMEITLKYQGSRATLSLRLWQNKGDILTLHTTLSDIPDNNLWGWLNATFQTVQVDVADTQVLESAAGYFRAAQQPVPKALQDALTHHTHLQTTVRLPAPQTISDLFI